MSATKIEKLSSTLIIMLDKSSWQVILDFNAQFQHLEAMTEYLTGFWKQLSNLQKFPLGELNTLDGCMAETKHLLALLKARNT